MQMALLLGDQINSWHNKINSALQTHNTHQEFHRTTKPTRMWANAQRDGRPAKYRWRALFNAAKFGWRPLLECRAVTLLRRESRWNLQGCPKLANRSQPLVGRSSPHVEEVPVFNKFFFDCRYMPQLRRYSPTKLCDGAKMAIFCVLYFQRAACSTFQTCILNLH